jgi:molecular chaperone DnaJ
MAKDYYDVLGVAKGADEAALKSAYRKAAMQHHPDRNPGDTKAEAKFKEINEAYDVLKDPQKRAAYDRMGHAAFQQGGSGGNPYGAGGNPFGQGGPGGGFQFDGNFEDLFEDLMGGLFGGQGGQQSTRKSRSQRGADLKYTAEISLEDVLSGTSKTISFPSHEACKTCEGSGAKKGTKPVTCDTCNGSGSLRMQQGFFTMQRTCPDCAGTGQIVKEKCSDCHGSGRTRTTRTVDITIPLGVDDGTRLRLAGEGEAGMAGGQPGDLYVFTRVAKHKVFERDGDNLHISVPIGMVQAALGATLEIPKLGGGKVEVKVPAGSQPGTTLRLRDLGLPPLGRPRDRGDLLVELQVEVPTKLTKEQIKMLEKLQESGLTPTRNQSTFWDKLKDWVG